MNVLVIFSSCDGATEKLALAAAVGAVQARANIRLRRLPENFPESGDDLARMRREYVPPTQADAIWAHAIIVGVKGKIGDGVDNVDDATTYGRRVALSFRVRAGA